jgi:GTPase SAR1 family protein
MKKGQLIMGPAGSGKSTYCLEVYKNSKEIKKWIKIVNLDPSVDNYFYPTSIDVQDLIKTNDVMDEFSLGPNGSLIFCMEYLIDNLNWLKTEIDFCFEEFFLFDLPGQIEIYTHSSLIKELTKFLILSCQIDISGLFFIDSQFLGDTAKYLSGCLTALSSMISLEIMTFNVLSKMDLIRNIPMYIFEKFLNPSFNFFLKDLDEILNSKYKALSYSILILLEDFSMIKFVPLDLTKFENLIDFFDLVCNFYEIE